MSRFLKPVPRWVVDGWYANNPEKQRFAIARYYQAVTTEAERLAAQQFVQSSPTYPCSSCQKFAFAKPTVCYHCAKTLPS